jgi:hypothetical protein
VLEPIILDPAAAPSPAIPLSTAPTERTPDFDCLWNTNELHFDVDIMWGLPKPLPGVITQEMHDDAMKMVTSMIENPYIP